MIYYVILAAVLLQVINANPVTPVNVTEKEAFVKAYSNIIGSLLVEGYDIKCFIKHSGRSLILAFTRTVNSCVGDSKQVANYWDHYEKEIKPCYGDAKKNTETGAAAIQNRMNDLVKCSDKSMKYFMEAVDDPELVKKVIQCVPKTFDALLEKLGVAKDFQEVKQCYE